MADIMVVDSIYAHGLARVALCAPQMTPANPAANVDEIIALARKADEAGAALALFPELTLSGYAIDDLLMQGALLDAVDAAVRRLVEASRPLMPALIVGAPLRVGDALYNCAVVIHRGRILGVAPKTYLPNYREFYEKRHFAHGDAALFDEIALAGQHAPFSSALVFAASDAPLFSFHVEICEDLWAPHSPSTDGALAGARILCNLSASNIVIGKARERALLCDAQSTRCLAAYLYAGAGAGESTTDLAWDGHLLAFENGRKLAEGPRFAAGSHMLTADIDLELLQLERLRMPTFADAAARRRDVLRGFRTVAFDLNPPMQGIALRRDVARFPFAPDDPARLDEDCSEAYHIQVAGLATRLKATGIARAVIGVSGGLDSTQALLVTAAAFDRIGLPRRNIIALTMPGFATSERTRANALALMQGLGVDGRELDIRPAARQMFSDIGHPFARGEPLYDVTFENVQAGLRTDFLFRIANQEGGLVIGTGDLSELALGWCTYGVGDHMSHYNVNASLPKTLIQHLIRWRIAGGGYDAVTAATLTSILETGISPELVPADAAGAPQSTELAIGPYALADFTLFYMTRYGFRPSKIAFLAEHAWSDVTRGAWPAHFADKDKRAYSRAEIRRWMRVFLVRFFANQFKRSCAPNAPKISSGGSLSPRGDWRMPSDASAAAWLADLDAQGD